MTPTPTDAEVANLIREALPWYRAQEDRYILDNRTHLVTIAHAAYALSLSRTVDREREAEKKVAEDVLTFWRENLVIESSGHGSHRIAKGGAVGKFLEMLHRYIGAARTYPVTPEPVVEPCDVCGAPDGAHDDLHDCVRHLRKALAATLTEPSHE